ARPGHAASPPNDSSSCRTCWDTPAWEMPSRSAAADTEPVSTKATQLPSCSQEGGTTLSEARFFIEGLRGRAGLYWFF
ncbi:MAG: hypothetical protein RJB14_802, partial [Pseudomonadota bacterium]